MEMLQTNTVFDGTLFFVYTLTISTQAFAPQGSQPAHISISARAEQDPANAAYQIHSIHNFSGEKE